MVMNPERYNERIAILLQDYPALEADLASLKPHYMELHKGEAGHSLLQKTERLFAMLCLLASKDFDKATNMMVTRAKIMHHTADKLIIGAVNDAPEDWKDKNQDMLYKRGIIRGLEKFYPERTGTAPDGDFGLLRQQVPDHSQPIIYAAIDCYYSHKNRYDWRPQDRTMLYVAAQLLPDGIAKTDLLNGFRQKYENGPHKKALEASAKGIRILAADLKITDLPALDDGGKSSSLNAALRRAANGETPAPVKPPLSLVERKLNILVVLDQISERDKEIYLYMTTARENGRGKPSDLEIVSRFTRQIGPKGTLSERLSLDQLRTLKKDIPAKLARIDDTRAQNELILGR